MQPTHERIIVSVGGSLIVPDQIDTQFLTRFRTLVLEYVARGFTFSIIAGGGKTARHYQEAAQTVCVDVPREDLDWLGIHATRMNGHLLRTLFREEAYRKLIKNPENAARAKEPVIIEAGWKPGWSTDYCAVLAARALGAKRLVNLSNIDYVYTADPHKFSDAQKIEKITWSDFRRLIPTAWDPGIHTPFDPIAAREAEQLGLEVAIINGAHLDRFAAYLSGAPFIGTVIS